MNGEIFKGLLFFGTVAALLAVYGMTLYTCWLALRWLWYTLPFTLSINDRLRRTSLARKVQRRWAFGLRPLWRNRLRYLFTARPRRTGQCSCDHYCFCERCMWDRAHDRKLREAQQAELGH